MDLIKASINGELFNVVNSDQYFANQDLYQQGTAIKFNNTAIPVRNVMYDPSQVGFYPQGNFYAKIVPPSQEDSSKYILNSDNVVDFNNCKSFKDVITATMGLETMERAILTSPDNIFNPIVKPADGPEMVGMKEACSAKNMDARKYEDRIPQFNNDIRLFNGNNLSMPKLISLAEAFDMKLTLTFEDASPDVPNPMKKVINVVLTNNNKQIR